MDPDETYYDLLKIAETASQDEIKAAYKRISHECHPDKLPEHLRSGVLGQEAERLFRLINEAYRALSDPEKRRLYDVQLRNLRPSAGVSPSVASAQTPQPSSPSPASPPFHPPSPGASVPQ